MDIVHLGHSSFKIRGKKATLITDPFDPNLVGLKFPKTEADIISISHHHKDHDYISGVSSANIVIDGPGEYEIKGVKITGIQTFHDQNDGADRGKNVIYKIEMDNITIAHLGDLGHKLNDAVSELLNGVDILIIPVGGYFTIDATIASQIITALEPAITIPMHYLTGGMNKQEFSQLAELPVFLKEIGKEDIIPLNKLSITKDKISAEPQVVVLE